MSVDADNASPAAKYAAACVAKRARTITFVPDEAVVEGDISFEDGKQAKIISLYPPQHGEAGEDCGVFIRLQSWCEEGIIHPEFDRLVRVGGRYRVTVEEI